MNPRPCACGGVLEPVREEVDVGVGEISRLVGWECSSCGTNRGACTMCGVETDENGLHAGWCVFFVVTEGTP